MRPMTAHPRLEALEARQLLSTCHVTRFGDSGGGFGYRGDLRYCVNKANNMSGPDDIEFKVTGSIDLNGQLGLGTDINIRGPGADVLTIDGRDKGRIFAVGYGAHVEISDLTITNGLLSPWPDTQNFGAGINNQGTLVLSRCTLSHNQARASGYKSYAYGGGIYNSGDLTVLDSTLSDNGAWQLSGWETDPPPYGGGIYNTGTATVLNSTLSENWAAYDPESAFGGGIANHASGTLNISNSTVAKNQLYAYFGATGGGIWSQGTLNVRNAIIAYNKTSYGYVTDLSGTLTSSRYNLFGNSGGGNGFSDTDILNVDAKLAVLQNNGGPTLTHALLPGSPAIDAGTNHEAPEFDQRGPGFPRIVNGTIDIGAFEVQATRELNLPNDRAVLVTVDWYSDDIQL